LEAKLGLHLLTVHQISLVIRNILYINIITLEFRRKTFVCSFQNLFDEHLEKITIIPQDIGHILVNIFNNAFYSMYEKLKTEQEGYEPLLSITTEKRISKH
jgi:two-component system, NtrC family, sensor kinase